MRAVHEAVRLALHENNTKLLQHCLVCHCVCVVYMLIVHVNVYMHVMCTCVYCMWSLVYPPGHVLCVTLSHPPIGMAAQNGTFFGRGCDISTEEAHHRCTGAQ